MDSRLNKRSCLVFIVITVMLDAVGIGLILPVWPELTKQVGDLSMAAAAVLCLLALITFYLSRADRRLVEAPDNV